MPKMKKRMRIFAGPNGSGKSTLFEQFSKKYKTGSFINADLIEHLLQNNGFLDLEEFGIKVSCEDFDVFLKTDDAKSLIQKSETSGFHIALEVKNNFIITRSKNTHSYESALLAMFLRHILISEEKSFSFETVMSHPSKLNELIVAKKNGYTVYLYFVCIDNPKVNVSRVENRTKKGGHGVDTEKVVSRYRQTLSNLFSAIELCDKAYLFDNSGEELKMVAEIIDGAMTLHVDGDQFPVWFTENVFNQYLPT